MTNNREDTIVSTETPDAFTLGHEAGYREAVEREHTGDATSADDAATWFAAPTGVANPAEYERGFLAGWAEFFEGRA